MKFRAIITMGPSILDEKKLKEIARQGDCVYRINGAHADEKEIPRLIEYLRNSLPHSKIIIDLPGNKIRTANLSEPIRLVENECFTLHDYQINYQHFYRHLKKGDVIFANDSIFMFKVIEADVSKIKFLSYSNGLLSSNKGLHVRGIHGDIPFMFEKDHKLLQLASKYKVDYLSLSFVRTAEDIREVKKILKNTDIHIIAKIETLAAVKNLDSIFQEVNSILIDRGDLSTEIDMLNLPIVQDKIVESALRAKKDVYLATQFLRNMVLYPIPLISEIVDLYRTVKSGITGMQLSEETAMGRYPVESVKLVFDMVKKASEPKKRKI